MHTLGGGGGEAGWGEGGGVGGGVPGGPVNVFMVNAKPSARGNGM